MLANLRSHVLVALSASVVFSCNKLSSSKCENKNSNQHSISSAVGSTPLIYLRTLSHAIGRDIYAKAEFMNPTSSVKDRAAKYMIEEAERSGLLKPGGCIVEATGGNTGHSVRYLIVSSCVALAQIGKSKGYKVVLTVPNMIAKEKIVYSERFGATVHLQPLVPFTDPENFERKAAALAIEIPGSIHTNQFDNLANFRAHFEGTGPEIWQQLNGHVNAFATSSGTGGTIGGVSAFLKSVNPDIKVTLVDPYGSCLYSYIKHGKLETTAEKSSIEGIGSSKITPNFKKAQIDDAVRVTDREAVEMAYYLMRNEGLFVGYSASLNVVGAVKAAMKLPVGSVVVTILCDGGERYLSKIYNTDWLVQQKLVPASNGKDVDFVSSGDSA